MQLRGQLDSAFCGFGLLKGRDGGFAIMRPLPVLRLGEVAIAQRSERNATREPRQSAAGDQRDRLRMEFDLGESADGFALPIKSGPCFLQEKLGRLH